MIEIFIKEMISLVKACLSIKLEKPSISPARLYFLLYIEIEQMIRGSNYFIKELNSWVNPKDTTLDGEKLSEIAIKRRLSDNLNGIYSSLHMLGYCVNDISGLLDEEAYFGINIFSTNIGKTLSDILGVKSQKIYFWMAFFRTQDFKKNKKIVKLNKLVERLDNKSWDQFYTIANKYRLKPCKKLFSEKTISEEFGLKTADSLYVDYEMIGLEEKEKIKSEITLAKKNISILKELNNMLANFIKENFDINELFQWKRRLSEQYYSGKS